MVVDLDFLAKRFCRAADDEVKRTGTPWNSMSKVAIRSGLIDARQLAAAVDHARTSGWIETSEGRVKLTGATIPP